MKIKSTKPGFLSVLLFAFMLTIITVILIGPQVTLTATISAFSGYIIAGFVIGLDIT